MRRWGWILAILAAITLGLAASHASAPVLALTGFTAIDAVPTPADRIGEQQLKITSSDVTIKLSNAVIGRIEATGSMLPTLNQDSTALMIPPKSDNDIREGDIVVYESEDGLIVHRILRVSKDEKGWFATAKGDNAPEADKEKIRREQIRYIVIGILY